MKTELDAARRAGLQEHVERRRVDHALAGAQRALQRQHPHRAELAARPDDQLQLRPGRAVRSLHDVPSRDLDDGARHGDRSAVSRRCPTKQRDLSLQMATPAELPATIAGRRRRARSSCSTRYGLALSETGIINDADVTVHYVLPESPAARAGLAVGRHARVDRRRSRCTTRRGAQRSCSRMRQAGRRPSTVDVRRGLDHPFTAHPRLDLYLSDLSPHPQKDVGCTICHDGQGSGTSFPWTSHTPDNADAAGRVGRRSRLVRQPPLDLPDEAGPLRREQLPEVPPPEGRPGAERAVPRAAGAEAGRGLDAGRGVRLLRLPRDQRLRQPDGDRRPRRAAGAALPRGGRRRSCATRS